ncbi:hypothetical protein CLOM_g14997 [Closterium sp. NIES-68]|nr:hypothetical protein CLOM_g14997 [Closterium sp. NIES-68]GJP60379.1 hypothetical protein CLOP_g17590 [Closterium sp. NIES-67]
MSCRLRIACAILVIILSLQWLDQGFATRGELAGEVGFSRGATAGLRKRSGLLGQTAGGESAEGETSSLVGYVGFSRRSNSGLRKRSRLLEPTPDGESEVGEAGVSRGSTAGLRKRSGLLGQTGGGESGYGESEVEVLSGTGLAGLPALPLKLIGGSHESVRGSNLAQGRLESPKTSSQVFEVVQRSGDLAQETKGEDFWGQNEADSDQDAVEVEEDTALIVQETGGMGVGLRNWKRRRLLQESVVDESGIGRVETIEREIHDTLAEQRIATNGAVSSSSDVSTAAADVSSGDDRGDLLKRVSEVRHELTQIMTSSSEGDGGLTQPENLTQAPTPSTGGEEGPGGRSQEGVEGETQKEHEEGNGVRDTEVGSGVGGSEGGDGVQVTEDGKEEKEHGEEQNQEAGRDVSGDAGAASRPIRLDWVKPVTKEEKSEDDKQKVAAGVCEKSQSYDKLYNVGPIAWQPQDNRYILMDCHRNQMSNRVRCIKNYLIAAGYLNRTLVVPLHAGEIHLNYERRAYFDVNHTRRCYGPRTVISRDDMLGEERARRVVDGSEGEWNGTVNLDQIVCFVGHCYNQEDMGVPDRMPNLAGIGISPNLKWTNGGFHPSHPINITDFHQIDSMLLPTARLITFSDLGATILDASKTEDGSYMNNLDLPFVRLPGCPNPLAVQPHPAILEAADAFVREKVLQGLPREWEVKNSSSSDSSSGASSSTASSSTDSSSSTETGTAESSGRGGDGISALVGRYMAIHWRRTDLINSFKDPGSHLTVEQTGRCVARKMIRSGNLTTLFLATDTNEDEVKQLDQVLRTYIPNLRLVRQPEFLKGEGWAAVLEQAHFSHMATVQAMLDKVICAMADVFSGTDASSFTSDIGRIRAGLRFVVCDDAPICHGQALVGQR